MSIKRWATISDIHYQYQDDEAIEWALDKCSRHKPDYFILNGDAIDGEGASRWPKEKCHTLGEEYDSLKKLLKTVERQMPKDCTLVYMMGNHEDNITGRLRIDPALRDLCAMEKHIPQLTDKSWIVKPYDRRPDKGSYRVGQVTFVHGHETHASSAGTRTAILAGKPWGLVCYGHTHKPTEGVIQVAIQQNKEQKILPIPWWYANSGCLMNLDDPIDYIKRKRFDLWGQACIIGDAMELKSPREGRYWDAEVCIRRMGWEEDNQTTWGPKHNATARS